MTDIGQQTSLNPGTCWSNNCGRSHIPTTSISRWSRCCIEPLTRLYQFVKHETSRTTLSRTQVPDEVPKFRLCAILPQSCMPSNRRLCIPIPESACQDQLAYPTWLLMTNDRNTCSVASLAIMSLGSTECWTKSWPTRPALAQPQSTRPACKRRLLLSSARSLSKRPEGAGLCIVICLLWRPD